MLTYAKVPEEAWEAVATHIGEPGLDYVYITANVDASELGESLFAIGVKPPSPRARTIALYDAARNAAAHSPDSRWCFFSRRRRGHPRKEAL